MQFHRLVPACLVALAAAAPLGAQTAQTPTPGTVEIGAFGQGTVVADTFGIDNPIGFGARLGAFINPRWQLEGDFSYGRSDYSNLRVPAGVSAPKAQFSTLAIRLNYNIPFATSSAFILGGGVVRSNLKADLDDNRTIEQVFDGNGSFTHSYGASGLVGIRYGFTPSVAVRVDALGEYHPTPEAFNFGGRLGLSYLLGGGQPMTASEAMATTGVGQPGTLEAGLFANYPIFASDWNLKNTLGGGARLGVFVTPRWQVEAEAAYSEADVDNRNGTPFLRKKSYNYVPLAARLNYNLPFGNRSAFILGLGAVRSHYEYTYNYGGSGLAGVRVAVTPRFAVRGDVVGNYMPDPKAFDANLRVGLSMMLGGAKPREEAAPVAEAPPPPPPAPVDTTTPAPPPPPPPPPVDTLAERRAAALKVLEAQIFFAFDRSDLSDDARATLDAKIPILQANPGMRIRIEGNTDPRGSDEYNLALGQRRANSARRYLVQRGIAASRFEATSRGEENRNCTEDTEECYAKNRRDEFVIIIGGENIQVPQQ